MLSSPLKNTTRLSKLTSISSFQPSYVLTQLVEPTRIFHNCTSAVAGTIGRSLKSNVESNLTPKTYMLSCSKEQLFEQLSIPMMLMPHLPISLKLMKSLKIIERKFIQSISVV